MMKRLRKILASAILIVVAVVFPVLVWLKATAAAPNDLPPLKSGDIIFQTSRSNQSLAIMMASKSPYSHMGIIEVLPGGEVVVLEAVSTVRETPLSDWIERGAGGRALVRRLETLTGTQTAAIIAQARSHFGKPYDLFFHEDRETIYCSELIDFSFRYGANVRVGHYQPTASLDLDNFAARKVIERRWQKHPNCADGKAANFSECYATILKQNLITPHSIAIDPQLVTLFNNYGWAGN